MDEKFMQAALKKACGGVRRGQTPFGACIVKDGRILSCAHNTVWRDNDVTAHAEVNAIRQACKKLKNINLSGCILYSTCEPCPMCYGAVYWSGIRSIVYGCGIKDAGRAGFSEMDVSNEKMKRLSRCGMSTKGGVLRGECLRLFDMWSGRKDRRVY